jgi:mRNA interferase RelE/StbE
MAARYDLLVKRSAEKELKQLNDADYDRIVKRLLALAGNPRPVGSVKLTGHDVHRLRIGEYRALYTVDDRARTIEIISVGHRKEIYR